MKNKIGILILCLFCQFCFGQIESRKIFKGQVRNDLAPVENVIVLMQIQKRVQLLMNIFFTVLAKVNDTFFFQV
jgi:hypothetical protein